MVWAIAPALMLGVDTAGLDGGLGRDDAADKGEEGTRADHQARNHKVQTQRNDQ